MEYSQENNTINNDNNFFDHRVEPPFPFRYEEYTLTRRRSIADITYNKNSSNNNAIDNYEDNDYDDVEADESPRKGILQQMFCLPLN